MDDARAEALNDEVERLRARIQQLEACLGFTFVTPIEWGLTASEAKVFGALMTRDTLTKDGAMAALYVDVGADDEPHVKIVDVFICKLRRKLKPFGLEVLTIWGVGYRLTAETKALCREQFGLTTEAAPPALGSAENASAFA